jgi:hypothetical protein
VYKVSIKQEAILNEVKLDLVQERDDFKEKEKQWTETLKEKEKRWLDTLTRFYEISKEKNFPQEFKTKIEQASSFADSVAHSPEGDPFEEDHLQ